MNYPDSLEIGNKHNGQSLNLAQAQVHFSMWCITSSPLILGNDVRNRSAADLSVVSNTAAIKVNQGWAGTFKCLCVSASFFLSSFFPFFFSFLPPPSSTPPPLPPHPALHRLRCHTPNAPTLKKRVCWRHAELHSVPAGQRIAPQHY